MISNDVLRASVQTVAREWNSTKLTQFNDLFGMTFQQFFNGKQTQERTKIVAPVLDNLLYRAFDQNLPGFKRDESQGRDFVVHAIPYELKTSLSEGNGWVGNGYAKTPMHLLLKYRMNAFGFINGMFAAQINIETAQSTWTKPGNNSNFSGLTLLAGDVDYVAVALGELLLKRKFVQPLCESL